MSDIRLHETLRSPGPVRRLALLLVWVTVASGAVVFAEPAPADFLMMGLIVLLPVIGLVAIRREHIAYLSLWLIVAACGFAAAFIAENVERATTHTAITLYLAIASFMVAAFVARNPARHARLILGAYTFAATLTSLFAIIGYFGLIPEATAWFTLHQRASGTFKDPNVFGPFLVPAIIYALHRWIERPARRAMLALLVLPVLIVAMLLTFSRGAWLALALSLAVFGYASFITAATNRHRLKLMVLAAFGVAALAGVVASALQIDGVARLFDQRAALTQSYDIGPEGRFGGQDKAIALILAHPFGIGAREFGGRMHPEDPHNVYLSMLLNAGWLGGLTYALIIVLTIAFLARALMRATATRPELVVVLASLAGMASLGFFVDQDHWRHLYLLLGVGWGLMTGDRRLLRPARVMVARRLVPEHLGLQISRRRARIIGPTLRPMPTLVIAPTVTRRTARRLRRSARILGPA
ncbi:MAG TPA: O-antigen ligase family protein [Hyphomicrobiaceae bacterium]|nr:O-antigen ligase family protein [Hyphomicrobiaceae bacterium]